LFIGSKSSFVNIQDRSKSISTEYSKLKFLAGAATMANKSGTNEDEENRHILFDLFGKIISLRLFG
jgi:hypothetical protein